MNVIQTMCSWWKGTKLEGYAVVSCTTLEHFVLVQKFNFNQPKAITQTNYINNILINSF